MWCDVLGNYDVGKLTLSSYPYSLIFFLFVEAAKE